MVDDALQRHQREHRPIGMVRDEFTLACQSHTIDAMGFEDDDGEIGEDAYHHQGDEQLIATGELSNEEDTRERRMHHTSHHRCHTQHGKVPLRDIHPDLLDVPHTGKEETGEGSDEQRRSEGTTATATTIGSRGSKHLGEQHQGDIQHEQLTITIEQGVVQYHVPIGLGLTVQQDIDAAVTLTIERREEEDERTEYHTAQYQLGIVLIAQLGKDILAGRHGTDEV